MDHLFVPYETALLLKEKRFHEPCLRYKNTISDIFQEKSWFDWNSSDFVSIPLYQQVTDWFREIHGLQITSLKNYHWPGEFWKYQILNFNAIDKVLYNKHFFIESEYDFKSYYEALNMGILELIKLI